ncbi:MAG: SDR family NAD(P)-dependent oxidoreductase [Candidatus Lokiarchaeota archaeon]|nr:SDR family NAD(P)-dependent oxidoreductase [Candidatus Lokiarchaeota archaeon]
MEFSLKKDFLKDINIVITGASTGIGKALAFGLADLGAKVGLMSRSEDKLAHNVRKIRNRGRTATYKVADVSKYAQIESAFEYFAQEFGDIHVLINNAAISYLKTTVDSIQEIDNIVDINLKGTLYGCFAIKPYFEKIKYGSIINTSSVAGLKNWDGASPLYDATKAAINRFTTTMHTEYQTKRIRINSILPGWVDTPLLDGMPKALLDSVINSMGVPFIKPEALVPYYAFFCSRKSKRVTGSLVNIVYFLRVLNFIENQFGSVEGKWSELESSIKKEFTYGTYANIRKNKRLMKFLLKHKI